jgi:hypothetical protein
MKKLILLCFMFSSSCWALEASNVVQNVNSYTGQVVTVSGKIDKIQKDSLSTGSYVVVMQGLYIRVFFDVSQKVYVRGMFKPVSFDTLPKPAVGSVGSYSGMIKREMGKPFLITPKNK